MVGCKQSALRSGGIRCERCGPGAMTCHYTYRCGRSAFLHMKSYKRLSARIERDKERKRKNRAARQAEHGTLSAVNTYTNWIRAVHLSGKGTAHKRSVTAFRDRVILEICGMINTINAGGLPDVATNREIWIRERGKKRKITPITVADRTMQHVICDNAISPLTATTAIRQNCANQAGKGTSDARELLDGYIEKAKREWPEIWALLFDFQNYFGSVPHCRIHEILQRLVDDPDLVLLVIAVVQSYQLAQLRKRRKEDPRYTSEMFAADEAAILRHEGIGMCLGSQISQDMAVLVPDSIDKEIKKTMGKYIRFADDGIILWHNREDLERLRDLISAKAEEIGLKLHPHKSVIVRADLGFEFLKVRYRIAGGKTIKRLDRRGVYRMKRKLRKFRKLVSEGKMNLDDVYFSLQSWESHTRGTRCRRTLKSIDKLYYEMFGGIE